MRLRLVSPIVLVLLAAPAGADWLVTVDGSRIETRGAWDIRGQLVVFHLAGGGLSSLRLSDVDLEASRAATRAAARAMEEEEAARRAGDDATGAPPPRHAVLVLTDRDVAHVDPGEPVPEVPEAEAAAGQAPARRLTVAEWREADDSGTDGVALVGSVRNSSPETLMGTGLVVKLLDAEGSVLATADARLTSRHLAPGAAANFRADFPAVFNYSRVDFEPVGLALDTRADEDADPAGIPALRDDDPFADEGG